MESQIFNFKNRKTLLKAGGFAALAVVALIPLQILIFVIFPPPSDPAGFFELFEKSPLLGLLSLDLLYYMNNSLIILLYLGLFVALYRTNLANMIIALAFGLSGVAIYFSSSVAFEMLSLSKQYHLADSVDLRNQFLAAGHMMIASYKGTAFDVYYVFNAITLLLVSKVMFEDRTFSRATAYWGLASGVLMIIPSTAGTIGLIFSLLSLIPWIVFSIMAALRLFQISGREN